MCGISALLNGHGGGEDGLERLGRMHDMQRHRGPDGEGCLLVRQPGLEAVRLHQVSDGVASGPWVLGLAVRRLRVQDPAQRSDQPFGSDDGTTWVALNGEIYNFRELRAELAEEGA